MKNRVLVSSLSVLVGLLPLAFAHGSEQVCQDDEINYKQCDNQLGWYLGGSIGYANTNIGSTEIDRFYQQSGLVANSIDVDDSDTSFSIFGGYQFSSYFAVEAGLIDLGERGVSFVGQSTDIDSFYDNAEHVYPQSGDGYSIAVVGSWPISESFKLSAKLGYFKWQGDYVTQETNDNSSDNVGSDSISGGDIWFGGELNYRLNDSYQLYLSAERFELARDKTTNIALGIRYFFGDDRAAQPVKKAAVIPKVIGPAPDTDNDGVIDLNDNCPESDIRYQVDTVGCVILQEQLVSFSLILYFANDSSVIDAKYQDKIEELATFITKYDVKSLNVYGHTSAPGSRSYNLKLSQRRAQSVAKSLASEFDIDQQVINPIGRGETELVDKSYTEQAHDINRRIELNIEERLMRPLQR
jgi:OOP family OmpA-OmpF porin